MVIQIQFEHTPICGGPGNMQMLIRHLNAMLSRVKARGLITRSSIVLDFARLGTRPRWRGFGPMLETADCEAPPRCVSNYRADLNRRASLRKARRSWRFGKDCEYEVQRSGTLIEPAATRLVLNRLAL
jgi:hypothetical protein